MAEPLMDEPEMDEDVLCPDCLKLGKSMVLHRTPAGLWNCPACFAIFRADELAVDPTDSNAAES